MKLQLPDVTLVGVETAYYDLAKIALEDCLKKVDFGNVITVSDEPLNVSGAEHHYCAPGGIDTASRLLWYVVPPLVKTSHFLICHWDSWVLCPEVWRPEFLEYDYIGAPWWHKDAYNVGNGGFSLRSTKLMQYVSNSMLEFNTREDDILCRKHRAELEKLGFKWPTTELAEVFAFERITPSNPTFGFHGLFNFPYVLSEEEIEERLNHAPVYLLHSEHYQQMQHLQGLIKKDKAKHGLCA